MISIAIPDFGALTLEKLVLDYNGTMAVDGILIDGVEERLEALAANLSIYILTADTFGKVREETSHLPCEIHVLGRDEQALVKQKFVESLGPDKTVAIGNGRNDRLMLARAALGVAVLNAEGAASQTIMAADVLAPSINVALDLLTYSERLVATLRS